MREGRNPLAAAVLAGAVLVGVPDRGRTAGFAFVPRRGRGPFPVALWLHGYRGWSADGYFPGAARSAMQHHADELGAVILGFPGTVRLPDGTFRWSENPSTDDGYVLARLNDAARTIALDLSRVALFGFSEGGLVAAELATLHPDRYLGAIVMSPGGSGPPRVAARRLPDHARQTYLLFCNAGEDPAVVAATRALARI
ncbi:MAG TPA: hypothetical protein VG777_00590 [Thermoanaerobaculia bacterium]|nr:hypothetical protein [Thermoanaerobaculia bacterium]